jgi:hypothetical protein
MFDPFLPSHSSILDRQNKPLELREHRVTHGPDATLGPYGPYRDWPPKTGAGADDQGIPGAPVRETATCEGALADLVIGETLAPLRHEEVPHNPVADPTVEV